jgi:hypothetical protein
MFPYIVLCSHLNINIQWLHNYLLPCPFKYLTGIDCPGCGFQRSVLALMRGDIHQSFILYPPAIPLILVLLWGLANKLMGLDNQRHIVKKNMFILMAATIIVSYAIKLTHIYLRYKVSA